VEDEWLVVYLLRELSKIHFDLWIEAIDTDGQFLLIEAANALPRWLNPEVADHRVCWSISVGLFIFYPSADPGCKVWIHGGKLLVIPLAQNSKSPRTKTSPISKSLTLQEAHEFIANSPTKLIHSPLIEAEAFYRLGNYPSRITENQHHALITIPRRLAYVLHLKPELISPAVESFYIRDPIALRPLQTKYPNSEGRVLLFPPEDFVTVSVKFTKVSFAQVKSQRFAPPIAWSGSLPVNASKKEISSAELGMKVSCGFEMHAADPQNKDKESVIEIRRLLMAIDNDNDKLPTNEEIAKWESIDDDESWLDISFEDFDDELSGRSNARGSKSKSGFGDNAAQENLQKMVERFEAFLNDDKVGIDGADVVDDMDVDSDDEDDEVDADEEEDRDVSFDENEFAQMMREMMGMPPVNENRLNPSENTKGKGASAKEESEVSHEDEKEKEVLEQVMQRMEIELNEAGVLDLDPKPKKVATRKLKSSSHKGTVGIVATQEDNKEQPDESDSDGEVDIDFNLAKNLLESFKSQAGMAGPSGNLLGMLGMQLPRDEDDGEG
jgi:SGT1 protein